MFLIGIKPSLADRTVDPPYLDELGLPEQDEEGEDLPIPTYAEHCLAKGIWQYVEDINEDSQDYRLYWTIKHGLMSSGGFGRDLYDRCFNTSNPSAIVMTADDYRADYDSGFKEPYGESLYLTFGVADTSGQTAGHSYYSLLPTDIASACSISPNRTWAWVMSRTVAGNRLGASSRLSTADYSSVILQLKKLPNARDGCAVRMIEEVLAGNVTGVDILNVRQAREVVRAPGFDIEETP
jgi:hypothetical protein